MCQELLWLLQDDPDNSVWDVHVDLLAWILFLGGAFAPFGPVREGYIDLIRGAHSARLAGLIQSWNALEETFKTFIWSEVAFSPVCKAFWTGITV
jgi:hypothetical protein